jgi:hypothetical protein
MRIVGPSSEDEMVLAFLRAEIDSAEYPGSIEGALSMQGYTRAIIDNADLSDSRENSARVVCLSRHRGFKQNRKLFRGFPDEVTWQRMSLTPREVGRAKYINQSVWVMGSAGTRLVADGAMNLDSGSFPESHRSKIRSIEANVRTGPMPPELILAGRGDDSPMVLVEGHSRATAYVLASTDLPDGVEVIIGLSPNIGNWYWY